MGRAREHSVELLVNRVPWRSLDNPGDARTEGCLLKTDNVAPLTRTVSTQLTECREF